MKKKQKTKEEWELYPQKGKDGSDDKDDEATNMDTAWEWEHHERKIKT